MQQHTTYLAVFLLLCVTLLVAGCNGAPDEQPAPAPLQTETVSANQSQKAGLGQEMRLEGSGFSYRPVLGYNLETEDGAVSMEAPDAGVNTGPGFFLTGGDPSEFNAEAGGDPSAMAMEILGTYVGAMVPEQDNFVDSPRKIARQQAVGMEVDYAVFGNEARRGRITVLVKEASQVFIMVGQSPPDIWDKEFRMLYKEVLGEVRFFEPVAVE